MDTVTTNNDATHDTLEAERRFGTLADDARVLRTMVALEAKNIQALRAATADEARRLVLELIPAGAQVYQGASRTLELTGITAEIETSGRYDALRPRLWAMDRATQEAEIRRLSAAPDVMLGSVHAVTEAGALVAVSAGGSQLGPYASGAGKVVLVVGTQKIVADLDAAFERIEQYVVPREDARMRDAYGMGTTLNKALIIHGEYFPGRTTVVFVDEALGF